MDIGIERMLDVDMTGRHSARGRPPLSATATSATPLLQANCTYQVHVHTYLQLEGRRHGSPHQLRAYAALYGGKWVGKYE